MEKFIGKWVFQKSENVEAVVDTFGVPPEVKKKLLNWATTLEVKKAGDDEWVIRYMSDGDNQEFRFKLHEPFEHPSVCSGPVKNIVVLEDGKMVEAQTGNNVDIRIVRELVAGDLVTTVTSKGVTGVTHYAKA